MKKFFTFISYLFILLIVLGLFTIVGGVMSAFQRVDKKLEEPSVLSLELEGVILDGKEFLENLRKYRKEDNIKGVLIQINSPGGVVGPSQEIYREIKRIREEWQKPIVVSMSAVAASGAYYAAVGADKIITNPGTLVGSIGVIMEFANLEKLYSWAKVERFSINTGPYKDSGAEYRKMREDERMLFQELVDDVHLQFMKSVAEGRKLKLEEQVRPYADGRIFTGEKAVSLGFADQVGTFEDAKRVIGEMSGLGEDPPLFTPPKKRRDFLDLMVESQSQAQSKSIKDWVWGVKSKLLGYPLYLMPGAL